MEWPDKAARKLQWFPFAFAVYPVLALAARNQGEYTFADFVAACVFCLAVAAVCYAVTLLIARQRSGNAALLTVAIVAWLFLSPSIELAVAGALRESARWGHLFRFRLVALASLVGIILVGSWLTISRREHPGLERFARIVSVVLLLSSGGFIAWSSAQSASNRPQERADNPRSVPSKSKLALGHGRADDPDIYLLILDQYANAATLRTYFQFDNSTFESELRRLGFQIPAAVHSNYAWTALSVASILNATHVDSLGIGSHKRDQSVDALYSRIRMNDVATALKERGYRYYLFPSRDFPGTFTSPLADQTASIRSASTIRQWIAHAPLLFHFVSDNSVARVLGRFGWGVRLADYDVQLARELADLPSDRVPKFVVAHFMLTHDPFFLDAACHQSATYALAPAQSREAYLASLQCTNRMLHQLLNALLAKRSRSTIVLLQGDHGTQTTMRIGPVSEVSKAAAAERFGAFGAYLLPPGKSSMPDTVGAVNLFPLLFNRIFGTDLPLESDRQYFSTLARPFALVEFEPAAAPNGGTFPSQSQ